MFGGFDIFVIVLVFVVILTIAMGIRTVPQGYAYTVERFGRYSRTLSPGLGLIVPYVERVGKRVNVMEQVLDVPSQEAFTRDNAGVTIDAAAFYQVLDAARASYEVSDLNQALLRIPRRAEHADRAVIFVAAEAHEVECHRPSLIPC